MLVDVPSSGLARIDLRFRVDGSKQSGAGKLALELTDPGDGNQIWSSTIATSILPNDGFSELTFPVVEREDVKTVRFTITPSGLPAGSSIAVWRVGCDCIAAVSAADDGDRDFDARILSSVPRRDDRMQLALDRIAGGSPAFAAGWLIVAVAVAAAALVGLAILLLGMLRRRTGRPDRATSSRPPS